MAPVVSNAKTTKLTDTTYQVDFDVSDNLGKIKSIQLPTWNSDLSATGENAEWFDATSSLANGHVSYVVDTTKLSSGGGQAARYTTDIYVKDSDENVKAVRITCSLVPDAEVPVIESFSIVSQTATKVVYDLQATDNVGVAGYSLYMLSCADKGSDNFAAIDTVTSPAGEDWLSVETLGAGHWRFTVDIPKATTSGRRLLGDRHGFRVTVRDESGNNSASTEIVAFEYEASQRVTVNLGDAVSVQSLLPDYTEAWRVKTGNLNGVLEVSDDSGVYNAVKEGTGLLWIYRKTNGETRGVYVDVVDSTPATVPLSSITISPAEFRLEVGAQKKPLTLVGPTNATDSALVWTSSDESVATVANGAITAVAPGTATITATAHDGGGASATCTVTVKEATVQKQGQALSGTTSYTKTEGDAVFTLDAKLDTGDGALSYESSNSAVAAVDASGKVSVGTAGTATITVKAAATDAYNAASMEVTVMVKAKAAPPADVVKVTGILLDSEELELEVGQSETLAATAMPANATNKDVTWTSSNKQVASVSVDGVVTAKKAGTATVKATATDGSGVAASCTVTVTAAAGTGDDPAHEEKPAVVKATPQVVLAKTSFAYDGGLHRPTPTVKMAGKTLPTSCYSYTFDAGCKNVGTYKVRVTLKNGYEGSGSASYQIVKAANPLVAKAKAKTLAAKAKKNTTIKKAKAFAVSKAQGAVAFKKASGNKKITVAKNGNITVKKGLKKGSYKVKVKVGAAGNANYKAGSKTVALTVKVK